MFKDKCLLSKRISTNMIIKDALYIVCKLVLLLYMLCCFFLCKVFLLSAEDFKSVQSEVNDIIQGRVLVGHALENDFKV